MKGWTLKMQEGIVGVNGILYFHCSSGGHVAMAVYYILLKSTE